MTGLAFADASIASLATAVARSDRAAIAALIAAGANANAFTVDGLPLLQWSMFHQHRDGFDALLAGGADPLLGDAGGTTALNLAAQADTSWWLERLLAHGVPADAANARTGETALMSALLAERGANADLLIDAGAALDARDHDGNTALIVAAKINQADRALWLLQAGADPSAKNAAGATFQRYLYMTRAELLDDATRVSRNAVSDWLRAHRVIVEDPAAV